MDILPKVPVPDLQYTLNMYLRSVKHLVSEKQFWKTRATVETFGKRGGLGERLQKQLLERRDATENWVYDYWLDDMYLRNRLSLPVNSSPALVFPRQSFTNHEEFLMFAARLILSVSEYKTMVDRNRLSADIAHDRQSDTRLCMKQYQRLFTSYRRAGLDKDTLIIADSTSDTQHVIVACKNQFFVLNLMSESSRLNEAEVQPQLLWIYEQSQISDLKQPAVGLLTSDGRTEWSRAREQLLRDPVNRESLELIESCMCIVCLDDPVGFEPSDANRASVILHGGGHDKNGANRWYDKPLQFVIGADGVCGIVCEHSPFEGIVLVQCAEYLLKHMHCSSGKPSSGCSECPNPRRLLWRCSPQIQDMLASAGDHLQQLVRNLDLKVFPFKLYGKEFIKQQKMSPDAYIQVALQLTIYRCYRKLVATYESASLRRFREGRVDNIRSATPEALDFAKAMTDDTKSPQIQDTEKMKTLLQTAVDAQTRITALVIAGMGTDNHLLGLREMAHTIKIQTPEIFTDETYQISNNFILSTSQVPTAEEMFCCYGPVVPDGYGVCYNPHSDRILFCVSSFRESERTCSDAFVRALDQGLQDMRDIIHPKRSGSY
ncbi:choline O-acetyltransferase isoform X1 [Misgurnus anguillicaudatus]|uniref:choline O-acetyltransferase isoform X1 n=2 Tax=Misgurnus anguillicaudatus TaxID=75329 RepID=UPI003CCF36E5